MKCVRVGVIGVCLINFNIVCYSEKLLENLGIIVEIFDFLEVFFCVVNFSDNDICVGEKLVLLKVNGDISVIL